MKLALMRSEVKKIYYKGNEKRLRETHSQCEMWVENVGNGMATKNEIIFSHCNLTAAAR
jgi:hypothetical protein